MLKHLTALALICAAVLCRAQIQVGVQLFDMYGTEAVMLMDRDQFNELRAEITEETRVFRKAFANVKKQWDTQYKEAVKAGNRDFPKFPSKKFIEPRKIKSKTLTTEKAANEWLTKQAARVDAAMAAKAKQIEAYNKGAGGAIISGYSGRDDKKARRKAEKKEMELATMEHLGEMVEVEMATLLKYNRPVPRNFIYDPVAGASKQVGELIAKQNEALEAYRKRKAEAEAALGEAGEE